MILSAAVTDRIKRALVTDDWNMLDTIVTDASRFKGKHAHELMQRTVNSVIVECAFRKNTPELLSALHDIPQEGAEDLFSLVLRHYITTRDIRWFTALLDLPEKLGKKSLQSQMISLIAQMLISMGISESDPTYIEQGLAVLNKITFRKYRSDSIIECIPRLTRWTVISGNIIILYRARDLIGEINDVAKRAVLHAEIAQALATIAIHKKNLGLFLESIQFATTIHQKLRRRECLNHIINTGIKSAFGKDLLEIRTFILNFESLPDEIQGDLVSALTKPLLDHTKNRDLINDNLNFLCRKLPFTSELVIQNLLLKADRSGDMWYLSNAIDFLRYMPSKERYPVREIVRSGITIAQHSRSSKVLVNLIPFIEKNCDSNDTTWIYLQFSQSMLILGDFDNASKLFGQISMPTENLSQYCNCLAKLIEEGVFHDQQSSKFKEILGKSDSSVSSEVICQAVHQISHVTPFADIVKHVDSLKQILVLRSGFDTLILDTITVLINRGFLDSWDSSILVDLAKSIQNQSIREQAISTVVMKLAEIGVRTGNRDFLQESVGITCFIEGQITRSATLSSIIDDAARLAASEGDLDLLLRMRIWSGSLLDPSLVAYAMTNIIEGVIKYAIAKQVPEALDEAYRIAQDIEDPSLRMQLCERIAESFVRIGCDIIQDTASQNIRLNKNTPLKPFEKGLQLLKAEIKNPQISLKIAGMIDIILLSSKKSTSTDYILPLALYSIEIENPLERNAMMSRIVANLNEDLIHPDSADPYEVLAYILQNHYYSRSTPAIIDLIHHLLDLTCDPFVRLKGLCTLADSAIQIHEVTHAHIILDEVFLNVPKLPAEYQKILVMADLTIGYRQIDPEKARQSLEEALKRLNSVEDDKNTVVRRQIVFAIVSMNGILPEDKRINLLLNVIAGVSDPIEYVKALVSAYSLVREDKDTCKTAIRHIFEAIEKIDTPYDQARLILEVVPLVVQDCDEDMPLRMLKKAESLSKTINIQHIADTIRDEIARVLLDLSRRQEKSQYLKKSAEILTLIEDDELRQYRLSQIGYGDAPEKNTPYAKITAFSTRIIHDGCQPGQIVALERAVRSVTDRGKRAFLFCKLSILFRDEGDLKTAKRMLNNAIKESGIIRPLSKRAYVRCDMAMKMYAAGYENVAQDILDDAIDAATNIRQSTLRDDVFNELGLAIKVMQGMQE
ncbi:MAG: hypothetical protein ABR999_09100 [Methanoregula sp.]|jgi:hypothetical protein|uniref:hypothetical protein n=1 Tax=Methanoregula sp. TaxID=2052170 RepID=UPI003D0C9615